MATLLCHIDIHPGCEAQFEAVMREMYRRTHAEEPGCRRYEYYRGAEPGRYYCLLGFDDRHAFLVHQASDYHEGFDFAAMIRNLTMEWLDPVAGANTLDPTHEGPLPADASPGVRAAADLFPVVVQAWWQQFRSAP